MDKFLYGTATAAYQIEGGRHQDGRKDSIWDTFCHAGGNTFNNHNADIACDHYNRMEADVKLMKELGHQAYRFSISWSRVLPDGTGAVNEKGLEFYDRLIDTLIDNGIMPCLTLYHWDLPQALHERGGWENPESIAWFTAYAKLIFHRYGAKVPYYMTFNEITTFIGLGYGTGIFAPGIKDEKRKLIACHHVLKAHGEAVKAFRALKIDAKIGAAVDIWPRLPERFTDYRMAESENARNHFWVYDALYYGQYPPQAVRHYESLGIMPNVEKGDMELISQKMDFIGLNFYSCDVVREKDGEAEYIEYTDQRTDFGWKICPEGYYQLLKRVTRETRLPIIVTENGMANDDHVQDGAVDDAPRVAYLKAHLEAIERANADGANVIGCLVWSLLDNFEWAAGYSKRFGIVYVDYQTQERIPKKSALWYRDYIAKKQERDVSPMEQI